MKKVALVAAAAVAAFALAFHLQSSDLYVNGKLASSGVIERNGVAYAPIKDIAAALQLTVQKTAKGYELSDSGGANQVDGVTGKIGDMLFNGYVRFQVVKAFNSGKSYKRTISGDNTEINPIPESNELYVVVCKLKNGMQKTVYPSFAGGAATALTDADGHSYEARRISDFPHTSDLLPGAMADFALVFDVPPGVKVQDLVFETQLVGISGPEKKKFRVSLQ